MEPHSEKKCHDGMGGLSAAESVERLYKLLWEGTYRNDAGKIVQARGAMSKIMQIRKLTETDHIDSFKAYACIQEQ